MQHLSKDQVRALLAAARATRERDWLMILVGYWHGLRASEVVGLTRDNVRDGHLVVPRLKGSMKTRQPLVKHADPLFDEASALLDYVEKLAETDKIFPVSRSTFWRLVRRYGAAAGIPRDLAHPHILKHSIAMQTIHSAGIENVRQYLGHKSLSSTGAYLKVDDKAASSAVTGAAGAVEST